MTSKPRKTKKSIAFRYGFALVVLLFGIVLTVLKIGNEFLGFANIGIWLIYVGFVMLVAITFQVISKKNRIVDERMEKIGNKTSRIMFLLLILFAFVVMVWDGISKITIPYFIFMSYLICGFILIYFIIYKILEKRY
jgi:uncharacterized membrane protein